jgi:hypothetical protein
LLAIVRLAASSHDHKSVFERLIDAALSDFQKHRRRAKKKAPAQAGALLQLAFN